MTLSFICGIMERIGPNLILNRTKDNEEQVFNRPFFYGGYLCIM